MLSRRQNIQLSRCRSVGAEVLVYGAGERVAAGGLKRLWAESHQRRSERAPLDH